MSYYEEPTEIIGLEESENDPPPSLTTTVFWG